MHRLVISHTGNCLLDDRVHALLMSPVMLPSLLACKSVNKPPASQPMWAFKIHGSTLMKAQSRDVWALYTHTVGQFGHLQPSRQTLYATLNGYEGVFLWTEPPVHFKTPIEGAKVIGHVNTAHFHCDRHLTCITAFHSSCKLKTPFWQNLTVMCKNVSKGRQRNEIRRKKNIITTYKSNWRIEMSLHSMLFKPRLHNTVLISAASALLLHPPLSNHQSFGLGE